MKQVELQKIVGDTAYFTEKQNFIERNLTKIAVIFIGLLSILTFFFAINTRAILINELSDIRKLESNINKVMYMEESEK